MNILLNRAVKLLEKIDNELLKVDSTEKKYQVRQINPLTLDEVNEFLDDYYSEVSFLNENTHNIIELNKGDTFDKFTITSKGDFLLTISNENLERDYEVRWKIEKDEIIIYQPFKEI